MTRLAETPALPVVPRTPSEARVTVRGKFLELDGEKFYVKGVTYGAFRPDANGAEYHDLATIERDFALMAENGVNAVRIPHTMAPVALLDAAEGHGLKVMVGLSAEQFVGFLADTKDAPDVAQVTRRKVREVAGHPAVLTYALGNEIPAVMVRWFGRRRIEQYLRTLYEAVKEEDPDSVVTYVNYPTTEYLQLPFLELVSFNVYLEAEDRLRAYLARLQNVAGDRPLLMSEVGLDSLRNGEDAQAQVLDWQIRTVFESGCVGSFVFAWTDEWYRGGRDVQDWEFGLTRIDRTPKPALPPVRERYGEAPALWRDSWPRISVVVCTHNGASTLAQCLEAVAEVRYPNFEIVVVDDGSTDASASIARESGCRVVSTPNHGLSAARNVGLAHATGEIVAYLDDDAYPDPDWLTYLALTFMRTSNAAVGGPNIPPPPSGLVADAVAHAPGGPIHVLTADEVAEHVPGCNLAVRREALAAIGGFDPAFRVAGDDVDVCWRLHERGCTIGFSPAAAVFHHRRTTMRAYWRQQRSYGKAEALLERKWPQRYNALGHLRWAGRVYGTARPLRVRRDRIYQGMWGSAPFQSIYQPSPSLLGALPMMPDWYLLIATFVVVACLGALWMPLLFAGVLAAAGVVASVVDAGFKAASVELPDRKRSERLIKRLLIAFLYLAQPLARLRGRLDQGLTPWRRRGVHDLVFPRRRVLRSLSESWAPLEERLSGLEARLAERGAFVAHGGDYDRWDLSVRGGLFASARVLMAVEDVPGGAQLVRLRVWPRFGIGGLLATVAFSAAAILAATHGAWAAAAVLGFIGFALLLGCCRQAGAALATVLRVAGEAHHAETGGADRANDATATPPVLVATPRR